MADITATAHEPMKSGRPHNAAGVWASALLLALSLSACGGSASDSVQAKGAASTQASSTGSTFSTNSTIAKGAALSSAELAAAEKAAVAADASSSATPLDELQAGQIAAKSAYLSGAVARKAAAVRIPVYRFFNSSTGAHFFTTNTTERDTVVNTLSPPFKLEGTAFSVASDFSPGLSPVHRFFNTQSGVHFYTISEEERATVAATLPHFNYEGVAYHASQVAGAGLIPFYRFYVPSKGFHFYTANEGEKDNIIANLSAVYHFEGVGYHVLDTDWRAEKLPHSGVTVECFQAGSEFPVTCGAPETSDLNPQQDAHRAATNAMRYSAVGGRAFTSCVRDDVTGLIWEGKTDDGSIRDKDRTYTNLGGGAFTDTSGYVAAVNNMNLCGFSDWRMPTRQELLGLVDYGRTTAPRMNTDFFQNVAGNSHWTSELESVSAVSAWRVSFSATAGGSSGVSTRSLSNPVRLVRGHVPGGTRFTFSTIPYAGDAVNNVVNDAWTGLQWRRCEEGRLWSGSACTGSPALLTHERALSNARNLGGWRLPNVKELASLTDLSVNSGARVDPTAFPGASSGALWASSPFLGGGATAWVTSFNEGNVGFSGRIFGFEVRFVRVNP